MKKLAFYFVLLAVQACLAAPASAYVFTRTSKGTPIRWMYSDSVIMRVDGNGSDDISNGSDVAAAHKSLNSWQQALSGCSSLRFDVQPDQKGLVYQYNAKGSNENTITWVEQSWPHDTRAVALTLVYMVDQKGHDQDGRIVDADIIFNGQSFKFSTNGATGTDIENALTHELGHLLGLDHTCNDGTSNYPPADQNGKAIPVCFSAQVTQAIKDTTMYNFADPGETKKRTLEGDDIAGVCAIYGAPGDGGGCAVSAGPRGPAAPPWGLPALLLLLLVVLAARRAAPSEGP